MLSTWVPYSQICDANIDEVYTVAWLTGCLISAVENAFQQIHNFWVNLNVAVLYSVITQLRFVATLGKLQDISNS